MSRRRLLLLVAALAAALPYLSTIDNFFVQDDFGVVWLLSHKPPTAFFTWFATTWMDDIWGYTPDEIRPFPALSYQLAALFGPGALAPNHVVNIAFHVVNALLVFGLARRAAKLRDECACAAAVIFAVLPMQTESVAWITGRVDSMPACFYLASFLLYVRWRSGDSAAMYAWSIAMHFVALFTKQNTITLAPALVLYDLMVLRRPVRVTREWIAPYVPFVVLTIGYMLLRLALFGHVAREEMITSQRVQFFLGDLAIHLKRMIIGDAGVSMDNLRAAALVLLAVGGVVLAAARLTRGRARRLAAPALYFGVAWIVLGAAPTFVAGYNSPRHMYLASAGWAIAAAIGGAALWRARPARVLRPATIALGAILLAWYGYGLAMSIRSWEHRSDLSHRALIDVEREALAAPDGSMIVVGLPQSIWGFSLPHALHPPFTNEDLRRRTLVISDSSLHCCPADKWIVYTKDALRAWTANPSRPPVVLMYWDETSGALSRLSDREEPFLRPLIQVLLDAPDVDSLDRLIRDAMDRVGGVNRRLRGIRRR